MNFTYTMQDLEKEIAERADFYREQNDIINKDWLVYDVVRAHGDISGEDVEIAKFAIFELARRGVEKYFNRLSKAEAMPQEQLFLPDLPLVRREYLVKRKGQIVGVPTNKMEVQELWGKVGELRKLAIGANEHADQLVRYIEMREEQERNGAG